MLKFLFHYLIPYPWAKETSDIVMYGDKRWPSHCMWMVPGTYRE